MNLELIILAAGEGKRMQSATAKVLHPLGGKPLLQHVLDTAFALKPECCHVVTGHEGEQVRERMQDIELSWVEQGERLGTGHAVLQALPAVQEDATVLVLYADVPLVPAASLEKLLEYAGDGPALLTAQVADPTGYGRVLRSDDGSFAAVVEEKDASEEQRLVCEINTGILAAPARLLRELLPRVGNDNAQGEYYLPDVLSLAVADGIAVATVAVESEIDILGVNDKAQLNRLEREYQARRARALMSAGATLADAGRIDIRGELDCARDVFIDANVLFEGAVSIGEGSRIGANCVLIDSQIGAGVDVKPFSHLEGVVIGDNCDVGPFARLRPETRLEPGARIGNFVETKKARIGAGSKVNHLSYIGDCEMGGDSNIGAGTITCNYDGANKHLTRIGEGAFIGSNSTLVAPLSIGDGGFVGAGSTVTREVENDQLAVSRARQRNLDGWKRPQKED
jgi:bifunctional UDP-N-acetylglucosamine pyrophosphorylase/glucosamine-1-phosphate N-acetyltransferase